MSVEIAGLFVYPVKSLRGIGVQQAELRPTGLRHDRLWMVVRGNGRFLTQRECPAMARVATRFAENGIELVCEDHATPLSLPLPARHGRRLSSAVWGDECEVWDQGDEAGAWLESALGAEGAGLRLVRMAAGYRRPQRRPERYGSDTTTIFADGAPLLVTARASLARLNEALDGAGETTVPMDRFRPNIVLAGLKPFAEHGIGLLRGPGYTLQLRYPCERCSITTVDQATGAVHPRREPWRTLRAVNPMPDKARAPAFGENAIVADGAGATVRLGDRLQALPQRG